MKRIDYFNLERLENIKRKDSLDTNSLVCNFDKNKF